MEAYAHIGYSATQRAFRAGCGRSRQSPGSSAGRLGVSTGTWSTSAVDFNTRYIPSKQGNMVRSPGVAKGIPLLAPQQMWEGCRHCVVRQFEWYVDGAQ